MSPHRWLLHARVRRAQQVLLEADARLAEVALASGFADQSHLTRVFRSLTGEAPGAWRRKHRQ
jgi:transcriptional regulator GlxA family with amidase domain